MNSATTAIQPPTAGVVPAQLRSTADWITRHWLSIVGALALLLFVVLAGWRSTFPVADKELPQKCWQQALLQWAPPASCADSVRRVTKSPERQGAIPAKRIPGQTQSKWAFEEPGWPRLLVWTDNLLVDLYTLFFVGSCLRAYFRLKDSSVRDSSPSCWLMAATVAVCLMGGFVNHVENFWLLAHIGTVDDASELMTIANLTAWKFRLVTLNLVLLGAWTARTRLGVNKAPMPIQLHEDSSTAIGTIQQTTMAQPGDIALVCGPNWRSTTLVKLQAALGRRGTFSHVLVNVSGNLWCQAMPGKGVEVVTTSEAFLTESTMPRALCVLRPPRPIYRVQRGGSKIEEPVATAIKALAEVTATLDDRQRWLSSAMYYLGQQYNFAFLVPKPFRDTTKFCSELVAAVMKDHGIEPFASTPSSFFTPADLQLEKLPNNGWLDFTREFRAYLSRRDLLPLPDAEDHERELLMASFKMLTQSKRNLYLAQAHSIKTELGILNLTFVTTRSTERLTVLLEDARRLLEESEVIGSMHRGAPWIGGPDKPTELPDAIAALHAELHEAKKFLKRSE
jgi:hypothetical protein